MAVRSVAQATCQKEGLSMLFFEQYKAAQPPCMQLSQYSTRHGRHHTASRQTTTQVASGHLPF
jgi:hypothetical protein